MLDRQFARYEQQPTNSEFTLDKLADVIVAVLDVTDDRMRRVFEVPPDLVTPAGVRSHSNERVATRWVSAR